MSQVAVAADPGPLARLEALKLDEGAGAEVFRLLTDPDGPGTLREIAKQWRVPRGRFVEWFTTSYAELYDAALKVRADECAHAALAISDEQDEVVKKDGSTFDPDVPRDRLRVDTRLKLAEKWDRARYGAQVKVEHAVMVVDAGLVGFASDLLLRKSSRIPVTIEAEPVPQDVRTQPELARPPADDLI